LTAANQVRARPPTEVRQVQGRTVLLFGRMVRVGYRDAGTVYVVAESDPATAIEIIRNNVAGPHVELQDLGRVNANLLKALALEPGQFIRA
jgi:hypothetical protein